MNNKNPEEAHHLTVFTTVLLLSPCLAQFYVFLLLWLCIFIVCLCMTTLT